MAKVQNFLVSLCYFQTFRCICLMTLVKVPLCVYILPLDRKDLVSLPSALRQGAEGDAAQDA